MKKPNFVFIMTDTQGVNMVESYAKKGLMTPNLDKLASDGIKFNRAYTTCPLCTPARSALFTGNYGNFNGAWANHLAIGDNIKTMGQRFRDGGYKTAYTGKWHLDAHDYYGSGICPDGWDNEYWYDGRNHMNLLSQNEKKLWREQLNSLTDLKENSIKSEWTWGHQVSNRAIDFLSKQDGQEDPFLLVVSYDEPHGPFTCPSEYVESFEEFEYDIGDGAFDSLEGKPQLQKDWAVHAGVSERNKKVKKPMYFGCNSFVDNEIGRVLKAIDQHAKDNTIIIFTSDHGDMMSAHGLKGKGPVMYEEITHIPLLIKFPDRGSFCQENNTLVSHVDILPTMLELADLDIPDIFAGKSLVSTLKEEEKRSVFIEFNRFEVDHDGLNGFHPIRCIVKGDYKLSINLLDDVDELYDLKNDSAELINLILDENFSDIRDAMLDELIDYFYKQRDPMRGPCWEKRPWNNKAKLGFKGGVFRPRPKDGYAPSILNYFTGEEVKSATFKVDA
ncbi:MAG: sulfatase-like hydrolase/transferase [Pseudomonadales bacterium]|nr:sulfatase-like hydrolase/transferase [Pseudomonadales bacterium]PCJ62276.1 MAG: hypothetical protein COA79_04230 [Planctomycetota bacterium]